MSLASFTGLVSGEIPVYLELPITRANFCCAKTTDPIDRINKKNKILFINPPKNK